MYRLLIGWVALLTLLLTAIAASAQGPTQSCDEQLKIVLKHDQDLDQHRRQLEIRVASQAATLEDKDKEIAKLKADLAAAKPKEPAKKESK